jgi:glycosyltransferase involved in cell wall biosynthesis
MGTYNGEKYIREQLDSIAAQTHKNWRLVISDDGSTDRTLEIARQWSNEVGEERVEFRSGPQKGFAQNFLSMACDPGLIANFYAFCDQDDVWMENKLEVAVSHLNQASLANQPSLYCGRTEYVDDQLKHLGYSPLFLKPPVFKNALVQSIAGGNTMIFNQSLKNYLEKVGVVPAVSHDWWLYQLTTGMNGHVFYNPKSCVLYRQHQEAVAGRNTGFFPVAKRVQMALNGDLRRYTDQTILCLEQALTLLRGGNKQVLTNLKSLRSSGWYVRTLGLIQLGLYRQTILGNIALRVLMTLRKI